METMQHTAPKPPEEIFTKTKLQQAFDDIANDIEQSSENRNLETVFLQGREYDFDQTPDINRARAIAGIQADIIRAKEKQKFYESQNMPYEARASAKCVEALTLLEQVAIHIGEAANTKMEILLKDRALGIIQQSKGGIDMSVNDTKYAVAA